MSLSRFILFILPGDDARTTRPLRAALLAEPLAAARLPTLPRLDEGCGDTRGLRVGRALTLADDAGRWELALSGGLACWRWLPRLDEGRGEMRGVRVGRALTLEDVAGRLVLALSGGLACWC